MGQWRNDIAEALRKLLAASLKAWTWDTRPSQLVDYAGSTTVGAIVPGISRLVIEESETDGDRCIDLDLLIGIGAKGADDDERIRNLGDAFDDCESAIWTATAPGSFMDTYNIDQVTGINCQPGDIAGVGVITLTLRLFRSA